jgi:hypothetical protein
MTAEIPTKTVKIYDRCCDVSCEASSQHEALARNIEPGYGKCFLALRAAGWKKTFLSLDVAARVTHSRNFFFFSLFSLPVLLRRFFVIDRAIGFKEEKFFPQKF